MDRTPPTAADIKSLASDVARIRDKANEGFRALATAAAEILLALDAMSERLANVPAVAPEDAFDVALHGAETVRATDGTLPDNLGASPRVERLVGEAIDLAGFPVVRNRYHDGTGCPCLAPEPLDLLVGREAERRACGIMFDAGGYSLGCTLAEGHEHPEKHDATPGPCAKAEDAIHAGPDGLKVSA